MGTVILYENGYKVEVGETLEVVVKVVVEVGGKSKCKWRRNRKCWSKWVRNLQWKLGRNWMR